MQSTLRVTSSKAVAKTDKNKHSSLRDTLQSTEPIFQKAHPHSQKQVKSLSEYYHPKLTRVEL